MEITKENKFARAACWLGRPAQLPSEPKSRSIKEQTLAQAHLIRPNKIDGHDSLRQKIPIKIGVKP